MRDTNAVWLPTAGAKALIGAVLFSLAAAGCGGGGSGSGGQGKSEGEVIYPGAVTLVDGRVGDDPFTDYGDGGMADGRSLIGNAPITVAWTPPTLQADQQEATRVAGYRIYFGDKPGNYQHVVELGDPGAESYRFTGLPQGTWYFALSAVDENNLEGPLSGVAAVTID